MRRILLLSVSLSLPLSVLLRAADAPAVSPEQLQQYLKQYPDADTNKGGVLTIEEARTYLRQMRAGKGAKKGKAAPVADNSAFPPTLADVAYGPHARNVL